MRGEDQLLKNRPLIIFVVALLLVSSSCFNLIVPIGNLVLQFAFAVFIELGWLCLGIWGISKDRRISKPKFTDSIRVLVSVIFGCLALSLTALVCISAGLMPLNKFVEVLGQLATVPKIFAPTIVVMLVVAPAEETLFRGYFFQHWRFKGFWKASLYSSLLFAAIHVFNVLAVTYQSHPTSLWAGTLSVAGQFLYKFLVGMSLCAVYEITQSLTYIIVLHGFIDTALQVVLTPAYPVMMIVYLAFSLALALFLRRIRMKRPRELA